MSTATSLLFDRSCCTRMKWGALSNTACAARIDDGKCAYGYAAAGQFGNAGTGAITLQLRRIGGKQFKVTEKWR